MENIKLLRIDNRLVHGQVGVVWVSSVNSTLIVVIDDEVAKDTLQQQLMSLTATNSGVGIRFFGVEKAIETIPKAAPHQKLFLVCRTPDVARKLVEACIGISTINVGNMHFTEGKRALSEKVFVNDQDYDDLLFIKNQNIDITIQDLPTDRKKEI